MSFLRLTGFICAFAALLIIFFRLRRRASSRLDLWVLGVFSIGVLLVSLFPGLVNLPSEILSLEGHERGRLLTLILISNGVLWLLVIYERGKSSLQARSFGDLVRNMALERFEREHRDASLADAVLVVIPAYNEARNLSPLLDAIPDAILGRKVQVLVVDDGSWDETRRLCRQKGVLYARNSVNRGGGAALRVGFEIARRTEPAVIVTMDGDGQHQPDEMASLAAPVLNGRVDLVIGSRMLGTMERYSVIRHVGVGFFGRFVSLLTGRRITDPASGFRAFNLRVLETCTFMQDQYHTSELIIEASKAGLAIVEVPVRIRRRLSGESKKGKDWKYALFFLRTIFKTWMK